jgi:hypothetical protein
LRLTQFSILAALALKGPTPQIELAEILGEEELGDRVPLGITKGVLSSSRGLLMNASGGGLMIYPRLDPRTRTLLRAFHIGATGSVLGADLALLTLGLSGLVGADPLTIYPAARLVAARVIVPLALVSLGTGVLLAVLTPWGLFRHLWITMKLAIVLLLTAAVLFVLVPGLGTTAAQVLALPTPAPGAVSPMPLVIAPAVASTLIGVALVLAVIKPDWRRRGGRYH